MNNVRFSLIAVLGFALCIPSAAQSTLEQCVEMAYRNYPQIQEYDLIEASRKYDIANASAAWLPQLTLSGKATWQSAVVEMPFEIQGMEFNIPHDQYGVTADVTQQLWDGGATSIRRQLADAGADVKKNQLEVNLYNIRSRVQNIYLGINLLDRQIELNRLLQRSLQRKLDEIDAMIDNGVAYPGDKDQVKVSMLSCEQQRIALETDRKAYVRMLGMLTGTDMQGESFPEPDVDMSPSGTESHRPELALYDAQLKQIDLQKKQLNANLMPRLNFNLQAGYGRPGLNMLSGEFDPYLLAGLRLQWNFGGFYTHKNDMRKIQTDAMRTEIARRSFIVNNSIEAVQKSSEVEKAADVLSRDEEIIRLRESILETADLQYREGVIKMNDYLSLLDEAFKAKLNSNIHAIQYIMAVCDLRNTMGNIK